jgi:hypothetical protein
VVKLSNVKIALTNLGKYNEGKLVFTWLELPCTDDELEAAKAKIGINEQYEEWFITDFETDIPGLKIGEYENIEELNDLITEYDALAEYEQEKVAAIIEAEGISLKEAMEIDPDEIELITDVKNDYDLGYYYINETGIYDLKAMGNLANYIDYKAFGYDVRIEQAGSYTSHGYVSRS